MGNTLGTNQLLQRDQSLSSNNGKISLLVQNDGNVVLRNNTNGSILWTSGTAGKPIEGLFMQWDGNLHISNGRGTNFWSTNTGGHNDAFLRLEDDGSMFVWDGSNHQIWDAGTGGFRVNPKAGGSGVSHTDFGGIDKFIKEAASTVADVTKVVGPIAAIVVNIIPGVGQAASVAIAGAMAILSAAAASVKTGGKGVLNSVLTTIAQNIPGGDDPKVQAALSGAANAVDAAVAGRPIQDVINSAISGLPIDPNIKATLTNVVSAIGAGVHIDSPDLQGMITSLPITMQGAIKIGVMTGQQANIHAQPSTNTATLTLLQHVGLTREHVDHVAANGKVIAGNSSGLGYDIGVGTSLSMFSPEKIASIRNLLSDNDKKGFDIAVSLRIGQGHAPAPPGHVQSFHPIQLAAQRITFGMRALPTNNRVAIMQNMADNPNARIGAVIAVQQIANSKQSFWHTILRILTLGIVK